MKIANPMTLQEIIQNYDALIVDLWGVIHDGDKLYPNVAETLQVLHELNKPVLFLSNAPRVSAKAQKNLDRLGIPRNQYLDIVTSGQVAHDLLARQAAASPPAGEATRLSEQRELSRSGEGASTYDSQTSAAPSPNPLPQGERAFIQRYFYLGPSKDEDVLADLPNYVKVDEPAEANFILCTGYAQPAHAVHQPRYGSGEAGWHPVVVRGRGGDRIHPTRWPRRLYRQAFPRGIPSVQTAAGKPTRAVRGR
jgi:Haloacid dehalogenase-like hydrolase